jgi:hypothetical protein
VDKVKRTRTAKPPTPMKRGKEIEAEKAVRRTAKPPAVACHERCDRHGRRAHRYIPRAERIRPYWPQLESSEPLVSGLKVDFDVLPLLKGETVLENHLPVIEIVSYLDTDAMTAAGLRSQVLSETLAPNDDVSRAAPSTSSTWPPRAATRPTSR